MKKKKYRKLSDYPKNVPRALIRLYRSFKENGLSLAKHLQVNDAHLSKLFNKGVEPKDPVIRQKLMLKKLKIKKERQQNKPRIPRPEWMNEWLHLPTQERHKVIQQYLNWRKSHG